MFYFYDEYEARCYKRQKWNVHLPKWQFCNSAHPPFAMKFDTNLRACTSCPCPMEIARHSSKISQHIMMECDLRILGSESFTRWLVWGASARELGKVGTFLHPHCLWLRFESKPQIQIICNLTVVLPMPRFRASPSIWFVGSDPILKKQMRGVRGSLSPQVASRSRSTGSA